MPASVMSLFVACTRIVVVCTSVLILAACEEGGSGDGASGSAPVSSVVWLTEAARSPGAPHLRLRGWTKEGGGGEFASADEFRRAWEVEYDIDIDGRTSVLASSTEHADWEEIIASAALPPSSCATEPEFQIRASGFLDFDHTFPTGPAGTGLMASHSEGACVWGVGALDLRPSTGHRVMAYWSYNFSEGGQVQRPLVMMDCRSDCCSTYVVSVKHTASGLPPEVGVANDWRLFPTGFFVSAWQLWSEAMTTSCGGRTRKPLGEWDSYEACDVFLLLAAPDPVDACSAPAANPTK